MKLLPYFKWFPADAESDEFYSSLTDEELGFFHRCLNKSWVNEGLPVDLGKLAAMMGYRGRPKTFARLWSKVGQVFKKDGQRFKNSRQELERADARTRSLKATESVKRRYERSTDVERSYYYSDSDSDKKQHSVQFEAVRQRSPRKSIGRAVHEDLSNGRITLEEAMKRLAENDERTPKQA